MQSATAPFEKIERKWRKRPESDVYQTKSRMHSSGSNKTSERRNAFFDYRFASCGKLNQHGVRRAKAEELMTMESRLALFSIVVTGESHNPTILNPDFLHIREIVPHEWQGSVKVVQAITSPPFAIVAYSNGISVVVENEKLQVVDTSAPVDPPKSVAVQIASKYVRTLPHVRYKAVGVNFHSVIVMDSAREFLKKRFVKSGPWDSESDPLTAAGIRLMYTVSENGHVVFDLDAGEQKSSAQESATKSVVIVKANFHRGCEGYPAEKEVVGHLGHVKEDWDRYQRGLNMVLAQET